MPGTTCFQKVVEAFGSDVVGEDGRINRRVRD
jgi:dephospho-CoA kinase